MNMASKVYFCKTITPEKVLEMYNLLGIDLPGSVAVKLHSGEKGNQNFLGPDFWKPMIDHVQGTVVECNTAY
ncbi:MAG: ferredoxin, partial [Clostridium sp.]|nr:ferredoxin [Clostridium sp.]